MDAAQRDFGPEIFLYRFVRNCGARLVVDPARFPDDEFGRATDEDVVFVHLQ